MGIEKAAAETAVNLVNNENVQNKAVSLLGMLFPYAGIEKRALDMYVTDVEKSNISSESKLIAVLNAKETIKKLKNQKNVAEIAVANSKKETVFDASSGVSQEWLERFMNSAGFVSEEQVQLIWGKILANEFNTPGSTPLNMIRILSEITPKYAQAFQKICSMKRVLIIVNESGKVLTNRSELFVPYQEEEEQLTKMGLSFEVFNELETLGLIKFDSSFGFATLEIPEKGVITYTNGETREIEYHDSDKLPIGDVILTEAGACLQKIIQTEKIENYETLEKDYMIKKGVRYKNSTEFHVTSDDNGNLLLNNVIIK